MTTQRPINLDHHASTPCDPEVVAAMLPFFSDVAANPSSGLHRAGRVAAEAVDRAREAIANGIGARPNEIVFTSGATESNNLAIMGLAWHAKGRRHIVASAIEHKSVIEPMKALRSRGFEVTILPVQADGSVDPHVLRTAVTGQTLLVSIQAANNEIGTIQPVAEFAAIAHSKGALFHCDAAQAIGKFAVNVSDWDADMLSVSAHKIYGPKGIGCLFVRHGNRNLPIEPLLYGGGQEQGLRSGTLNVPGIVGFGKAVEIGLRDLTQTAEKIAAMRDHMEERIRRSFPEARRNGALGRRLPGNSSITIPGVDAEAIITNLADVALSTGSACTNGAPDPSHVLLAIGLNRADAFSTIRIGIGKDNRPGELEVVVARLVETINRIRALATI